MGQRFSCSLSLVMNRQFLALRAGDLQPDETPLTPGQAWALLRREMLNPRDIAGLTGLWRALGQNSHSAAGTIRAEVVKEAFVSRRWVLLARTKQLPTIGAGASADTIGEQLKAANVVKTWIEMEVVDEDGKPMPGQPYKCMMPNGTIEQGKLDNKGRLRFDGIDPGNCVFILTDLAPDMWARLS